jgi:hypothetical protein
MRNINTTIQIGDGSYNTLFVTVNIVAEREGGQWTWEITSIVDVELQISNKVGVDITKQVLRDRRAAALILNQVADEQDQIVDFLNEGEDENEVIDKIRRAS